MTRVKLFVAGSAACLAVAASAAWPEPNSASDADAQITSQVEAKLAAESNRDMARQIHVSTSGGVVTLSGWADSVYAEQRALSRCEKHTGRYRRA